MKIAALCSAESLMSLTLTTTYENGIYRGVSGWNVPLMVRRWKEEAEASVRGANVSMVS